MDKPKDAQAIVDSADGSKIIPLRRPLTIAGTEVKALRMREPLVEDTLAMDKMGGTDADKELFIMSHLCGLAPTDLHKLPTRDYKRLQGAYVAFHD
jgi:hypothetical protein